MVVTIDSVLQYLMEQLEDPLDHKVKAYVDRLLLRFITTPALLSFLENVQVAKHGNDYIVELVFRKVPDDQIQVIKDFIAEKNDPVSFEENGQDYFGFTIKLSCDELTDPDDESNSNSGAQP